MFNRIRREPRGFIDDSWHIAAIAVFILGLIAFSKPMTDFAFRSMFIDVKSVNVQDHYVGENPKVTVYRQINYEFQGSFSVNIRKAQDGGVSCLTSWPTYFPYLPAASVINPKITDMQQWVGDAGQLETCTKAGKYPAGTYYIDTCHRALLLNMFVMQRCVPSNFYKRMEPE